MTQDIIIKIPLCQFDEYRQLLATFFTYEKSFIRSMSTGGLDHIWPPNRPSLSPSDKAILYDGIYNEMIFRKGVGVDQTEPELRAYIEKCETKESKEDWINHVLKHWIRYEEIKEKVRLYVETFLRANPDFKYVHIETDLRINLDEQMLKERLNDLEATMKLPVINIP